MIKPILDYILAMHTTLKNSGAAPDLIRINEKTKYHKWIIKYKH